MSFMRIYTPAALVCLAALVLTCVALDVPWCAASAASLDIEVTLEPEHTGVPIPISVKLPCQDEFSPTAWHVEERPSGRAVPCQIETDAEILRFMVESAVSSRPVKKHFRFAPGRAAHADTVSIEHTDAKQLAVLDEGRPVLVYNYRSVLPEGVPEDRRRSCYIHPIYGPGGEILTDDFPPDHFHHRGLSWMWPQVKAGDRQYDLWTIKGVRQRFVKLRSCTGGQVYGVLQVANGWYTDEGRNILDETVTITTFRSSMSGRIVDIELVLRPVGEPVTIGSSGSGYGGLNFRFAPRTDTMLCTSGGALDKDVNRERFLWSDLSGRFDNSPGFSGVAIFDHPENPSHPTGWSNRFYGILGPSFTGIEPVTIQPEKPLQVRYRLWIHEGDAESGAVARAYEAYMHPPKVEVLDAEGD